MPNAIRKGRRILLTYITLLLLASASVTTLHVLTVGPGRLMPQVARFGMTAALCAWLYGGSSTARWITIALFTFAGTLAVGLSIPSRPPFMMIGIAVGILYLAFAGTLLWSTHVGAFLEHQQRQSAR